MFAFHSTVNVYTASCDSFCTICWIFSAEITSQLSQVYNHTVFSFEYMIFLKNHPQRRVFHNVNLSNLEKYFIKRCKEQLEPGSAF